MINKILNSEVLNKVFANKIVAKPFLVISKLILAAFTPFFYFLPLTLLFIILTIIAFTHKVLALNIIILILFIFFAILFSITSKNQFHSQKSASSILAFLFMGKSKIQFINFGIFKLLVFFNIINALILIVN